MYSTLTLRKSLDVVCTVLATGTTVLHLFQNDVIPTPDMVAGDFVEADYTGYATVDVEEIGVSYDNADGDAERSFTSGHFQPTASTVTNTVYGYYLTTGVAAFGGAGSLLKAERFDAPVPLLGTADAVDVTPVLRVGQPVMG